MIMTTLVFIMMLIMTVIRVLMMTYVIKIKFTIDSLCLTL